MAFAYTNFGPWGGSSAKGSLNIIWAFDGAADTLATIVASGYFNDATLDLQQDDLMWVVGSDDAELVKVTSATAAAVVTVAQVTGAAANLPLATGSIFIGVAGIAAALDMKADTTILIGNGTTAAAFALSGGATMTNAGVVTITAVDMESASLTNIADREVLIGTGATTANYAVMTGDMTHTNAGVTTVTASTGAFSVGTTFSTPSTTTSSGAGAVAITGMIHEITTTGTGDALTLADGAEGQWLAVCYVAEGAGADTAVITPTNLAGADTTIIFTDVGDTAYLLFTSAAWEVMGRKGINTAVSELTLAEGNFVVGSSAGVGVALDIGATDTGIAIGNGTTATINALTGDVTMSNAGVTTVAAVDLETATVTNVADTEVMIGTGAGTAAFAALSQDATMANTGAVTNVSAQGAFEMGAGASGTVTYSGLTTSSGPGAVAVTGSIHEISATGTGDAMTLANGVAGQRLTILYVGESAGADTAIMTPTTLAGANTTITFNDLGDSANMQYSATGGWYFIGGEAVVA